MSAVSVVGLAPSLEDARRAADELVAAGVGRVLLFGSVARGDATSESDIDLVAIYDDLGDYGQRLGLRCELEKRAWKVAGWPVDVFVTDAPEWAIRTGVVGCSFEAGIARAAVPLAEAVVRGPVDWVKEIGLPESVDAELGSRVGDVVNALVDLARELEPGRKERSAAGAGQGRMHEVLEFRRFVSACDAVHQVFEASAKAMRVVTVGAAAPRSHRIDFLLADQPDWVRAGFVAAALAVDLSELHLWHQGAHYRDELPVDVFDESYLRDHAQAAVRVARLVSVQVQGANLNAERLDDLELWCITCVEALEQPVCISPE